MTKPISLLICTRNRREHLAATLGCIRQLAIPPGLSCELVIVDNGSTDGTPQLIRDLTLPNMDVRVVQEGRSGASRARNAGLGAARGDILLFTDDDTRPPQNWVEAMCDPILSGEADAVAGKVVLAPHLVRDWMEDFHFATLAATNKMRRDDPQDMFGASMAFSRRVLDHVRRFDPELGPGAAGTMEDTLFAWQLKAAGYRLVFVAAAPVEHHFDEKRLLRTGFLAAARRHGRSRAYTAYHWEHRPYAMSRKIPSVRLNLLYRRVLLLAGRCRHGKTWHTREGITRKEYVLVCQISALQQYLKERKRPPAYPSRQAGAR